MDPDIRLSEITGIAEKDDQIQSFWPINVALFLLGGAIIGLSFYFLDSNESRPLYNPWTYAIATPVAVLCLSTLLSLFVSRVVEKSMQLAFLLSVLIHILLLVFAVNVVIFSRMWPEVLRALSRQQHQLELESLQARQYHRFSDASTVGQKPDHLRYVPTEHEPTKVEHSNTQALQLAENDTPDLASPSPELKPSPTSHLLERKVAESTTSNTAQDLASLARSESKVTPTELPTQAMDGPVLESSNQPAPLRPVDTAQRATPNSSDATNPALQSAPLLNSAPNTQLSRRETARDTAQLSPSSSEIRRSSPRVDQDRSMIPTPNAAQPKSPSLAASSARPSITRRRTANDSTAATQPAPPTPAETLQTRTPSMSSPRRAQRSSLQDLTSSGAETFPLQRQTAGGTTGSPSKVSLPNLGEQQLAASQNQIPRLQASNEQRQRGTKTRVRSADNLGDLAPQSPNWDGQLSLGASSSGNAPQLLRQEQGSAATPSLDGLSGESRDIVRASLGGAKSMSQVQPLRDAAGEANGNSPSRLSPNSGLAERSPSTSTKPSTDSGSQDTGNIAALAPSFQSPNTPESFGETQSALSQATRLQRTQRGSAEIASSQSTTDTTLPRSIAMSEIADAQVQVPSLAGATTQSESQVERAAAQGTGLQRESLFESSGSINLEIDAELGLAGLDATKNVRGPLLARRESTPSINPLPQIDSSRFARQNLGGPLAGGQSVPIPKPAFQQRIDRLQDKRPKNESSVNPQTELAIERGLDFLARTQRDDGSWRLEDYDTKLLMRSNTAATGLAILSFQGAGYTHQRFKHAESVRKALSFLVKNQKDDGDLYIKMNPASDQNAWLYSHAIASLALCEAYGMTQDPELRQAAQKSVDFIITSQDPQRGGWRYQPGAGSDTSVSGWFLMALKSAQLAGLDVPKDSLETLNRFLYLSQASAETTHLYRYNPYAADTVQQRHGLKPTAVMTSVGLLMRLYTGWDRNREDMQAGADFLLDHLPKHGTPNKSLRDTYYWYYATQVMFHMQGEHWSTWHDTLYPLLVNHQVTSGQYAGSWNPQSPTPDLWARYGGRLYVTTMNLLSLEVSYRHLPLYEAAAQ